MSKELSLGGEGRDTVIIPAVRDTVLSVARRRLLRRYAGPACLERKP